MSKYEDIKQYPLAEVELVLSLNNNNVAETARHLNVSRASLRRFLEKKQKPSPTVNVKELLKSERQLAEAKTRLDLEREKRTEVEYELEILRRELDTFRATSDPPNTHFLDPPAGISTGSATAVICACDWHTEGKIDPLNLEGCNEFNLDVAQARIDRLWQKSLYLLDFARNISNVTSIVLWLGGDLVNGAIHEELEETNFLGPTQAMLFVQDQVASGLDLLIREAKVDNIVVATNHGNHGRTTKRKRISTGFRHSWEWLAYNNLSRYYRNESKVTWKIAQGYHNHVRIQGRDIRFHHGDSIKYYGGVGGVTIPLRKKIAQWNKQRPASLDVIGHFHQFIDCWDFVCCGCLCGYNEYALEIGADYQPPTQTFIVIDKEYGKVLAAPIFLEKEV